LKKQDQNQPLNSNTNKSNQSKKRHSPALPENSAGEMELGEIVKPVQKGKPRPEPLSNQQTGIDKGRWSD